MSIAMKYGLLVGAVHILSSLISTLIGIQPGDPSKAGISYALLAVVVIITFFLIFTGIKEIRDTELNGELRMSTALKKGLTMALIGGVLVCIYTIIYGTVIDPTFSETILEFQRAEMEKRGMTEEQLDMAMGFSKMFVNPISMGIMGILMVCFWGLIQSLIAGAILKKDINPIPPPSIPTI